MQQMDFTRIRTLYLEEENNFKPKPNLIEAHFQLYL